MIDYARLTQLSAQVDAEADYFGQQPFIAVNIRNADTLRSSHVIVKPRKRLA